MHSYWREIVERWEKSFSLFFGCCSMLVDMKPLNIKHRNKTTDLLHKYYSQGKEILVLQTGSKATTTNAACSSVCTEVGAKCEVKQNICSNSASVSLKLQQQKSIPTYEKLLIHGQSLGGNYACLHIEIPGN